jgi:hypothetical protein
MNGRDITVARKILTELERFETSYVEARDGCWNWQRAKDKDGYGMFKIGSHKDNTRFMARAHRWSYEWFVGKIPDGLTIDHLCRNHCCVNPDHLEPVTSALNTRRGARSIATHCKRGHELTGYNLILRPATKAHPNGMRACRECMNTYMRGWSYQQRQKAKALSEVGA